MRSLFLFLSLSATLFAVDRIPPDVPPEKMTGFNVVILGGSRGEPGDKKGFNEYVLTKLFDLISQQNPKAIFFTGDLVLGLANQEDVPENEASVPAPEKDIYGNRWKRKGLFYSPTIFKRQLGHFNDFYKSKLDNIPFYPLPGFHESTGPDSLTIFKNQFKIQTQQIGHHVVYSVPINNAYFILFNTTFYDPLQSRTVQHYLTLPLLDWLNKELKEKAAGYPFVFVLGHEPAYSTTSSAGVDSGLDHNENLRDLFWGILQENKVTAYISGQEHLYDRSDRGVWQIITGGAGAPLTQRNLEKAFFHYLLLTIPDDPEFYPILKVIDSNGKTRDQFELKSKKKPIYQLRISKKGAL